MRIYTILIVNDAPDQLNLLSLILKEAGYRALSAENGVEGLKIARRELPDLIISDVTMPKMDGIEFCRKIRADEQLRSIPFLLLSALRKDTESVVEGLKAGADDYIEAPYEPMRLIAKAAQLVERKLMNDALSESENRFRTMIENVTDIISIVAPDGTILYESPSLESIFGYQPAEVVGQNGFDFVHAEDIERVVAHFTLIIENFEADSLIEYRFKHKDDSWRIIESAGKSFVDPKNGIVVVVTTRDITKRREMENALRASEERYRNFIEQSTEGIWRIEFKKPLAINISIDDKIEFAFQHGFCAECNDAMARMYGLESAKDLTGRFISEFLLPSDNANTDFLRAFIENGYRLNDAESHELDDDGNDKYFLNNFIGIVENGNLSSIWGNQRDVTEKKLAEQVLQANHTRLEKQNAVLNELTKRRKLFHLPVQTAIREITEISARVLETERVGVWLYDDDKSKIKAFDVYELNSNNHSEGIELRQSDYPTYFEALANDEAIVCDNVLTDSRTSEFTESYLKPLGITSMLDAPISFGGRVIGVVCHEHIGIAREWRLDEQSFAASMTGLISLLLEASERRQAENALQASREYLEIAQQAAGIGSFEFNFQKRLLLCSASMESLYGALPGDLNGDLANWIKYIHPEDLPRIELELKQITSSDEYKSEFRILTNDGSLRWILSKGRTFCDDEGKLLRLVGVNIDITERKLAESIIQESEKRYRIVAESASDMIITIDERSTILFINPAVEKVLGYKPEELVGGNLSVIIPKRLRPAHNAGIGRYLQTGERHVSWDGLETFALRSDGRETLIEISFGEYRENDKRLFTAVIRDVTERKRAEEALRRAEAKYRSLVEMSPGIVYLNEPRPPYSNIYVSPNVQLYGYSPEEWRGKPDMWSSIVFPEDRERVLREFEFAAKEGVESELEYRIVSRGGEIYWWKDKGRFIFDEAGRKTGWQGVILDVTETKKLEERLRQSQKLESIGRLAGGIAHDFNNMLTAINGYSELTLRQLGGDDPLRRNLEEIKKAGERSAALTQQLLAFSRQQVLQSKIIRLNEVIADITQMLHRLIGEHLSLQTILDPKLGNVSGDTGQLTQVIMNLAVNARDAMPNGGHLIIKTSNARVGEESANRSTPMQPGSYVLLSMTDTGTGIESETREHIFEPFYTTKEVGKGTGLGLATVYGIVKQSGGYIWVDSEIGIGTTFKVYLPRIDSDVETEETDETAKFVSKGGETILVVEDEEIVRTLTGQILEECGYRIIEANSGIEALAIIEKRECKIDLMMTDIVMPRMSGRELAEKLTELCPQMRVLFTSGYTDDEIVRHDVIEERTNFIQKPFNFDTLAQKVRAVLDCDN